MEFRDWFCLRNRDSFIIDPKINEADSSLYFGYVREREQVEKQIRFSFVSPGVPKMILIGAYGSGKTQMEHYIRHFLLNSPPPTLHFEPHNVMLDIEMKSRSDHRDLHLQLLEAVGKQMVTEWVSGITRKGLNLEEELRKIFDDSNVVESLLKLTVGGIDLTAWRWLTGQQLTVKELEQLRVTRNLGQIGAGEMVKELVGIGKLAELMGKKIIFLMDEAERFSTVNNPDAMEYLEDYFRDLAENENSSVGYIIAGTARGVEDAARFLVTGSVLSRIGKQNLITIPPIPTLEDVKSFIKQMLSHLVDQEAAEKTIKDNDLGTPLEVFPFEANAFDLFCEYATQEIVNALPRNIINGINECAIASWDRDSRIIKEDIVTGIAPLVFE